MSQRPVPPTTVPVRCAFCDALLATNEQGVLRIARGQLEAVIDGTFRASLVCYRPRCKRLNVVNVPARS
jgi:phage FluMu protein Com